MTRYYYSGIVGGIVGGCGCCFLQAANVTNSIMFCREQKLVGKLLVRITISRPAKHNTSTASKVKYHFLHHGENT